MQTLLKIIAAVVVTMLSVVLFFPGKEFYFALEQRLQKRHAFINETKLTSVPGGIRIDEGKVYLKGVHVATFQEAVLRVWFVYNTLNVTSLELNKEFSDFLPVSKVTRITLKHSVADPMHYRCDIVTDQGVLRGKGDVRQKKLRLYAQEPQKLGRLKQYFKKDEKGWYYEVLF